MAKDLFGNDTTPTTEQPSLGELRENALDQLREEWRRDQGRADRDPDNPDKQRRAARAKAAYLALRDYHKGRSLEEESARAAAMDEGERGVLDPLTIDAFRGRGDE